MQQLVAKDLGTKSYADVLHRMKEFTDQRSETTPDEIWLVQHPAVYTLGQAGKEEHVLNPGDIPVVRTDRGGQVTYHGPGQLVCYLLLDIRRLGLGVRDLVSAIERSIIKLLAAENVIAQARPEAPGVYVADKKVAALGLRIRKGRSYHGLSLNVDMDLSPFAGINPCGYEGLEVIDTRRLGIEKTLPALADCLVAILRDEFGYDALPSFREN
jgi:lipoyl(octanoyl) transferase